MGEILKVGEAMNRATTHTLPNADGWEERANLISSFRHPPFSTSSTSCTTYNLPGVGRLGMKLPFVWAVSQ